MTTSIARMLANMNLDVGGGGDRSAEDTVSHVTGMGRTGPRHAFRMDKTKPTFGSNSLVGGQSAEEVELEKLESLRDIGDDQDAPENEVSSLYTLDLDTGVGCIASAVAPAAPRKAGGKDKPGGKEKKKGQLSINGVFH